MQGGWGRNPLRAATTVGVDDATGPLVQHRGEVDAGGTADGVDAPCNVTLAVPLILAATAEGHAHRWVAGYGVGDRETDGGFGVGGGWSGRLRCRRWRAGSGCRSSGAGNWSQSSGTRSWGRIGCGRGRGCGVGVIFFARLEDRRSCRAGNTSPLVETSAATRVFWVLAPPARQRRAQLSPAAIRVLEAFLLLASLGRGVPAEEPFQRRTPHDDLAGGVGRRTNAGCEYSSSRT